MRPMKTLDEIAAFHGTDKSTVHAHPHGYAPHYAKFFDAIREEPIWLLEVGVGGGESIKTWLEFFPRAIVDGVDIEHGTNPWNTPGLVPNPRYEFTAGDQSSLQFWAEYIKNNGDQINVIIDDGGHHTNQIIPTFNALWPHVVPGGFYCIEDLGCDYNPIFISEGFPSHITFVTNLIHNANKGELGIESIHFSRELAIIQKQYERI